MQELMSSPSRSFLPVVGWIGLVMLVLATLAALPGTDRADLDVSSADVPVERAVLSVGG